MSAPPAKESPFGYREALARLKARERYEPAPRSRGPEKLDGIRELLQTLGNPEAGLRVVHVAGTNGKGMTAALVATLLWAAGRRAGLYASPHLRDIRERIVVDGTLLPRRDFAEAAHTVLDAAERMGGSHYLSYFDLLTAIGFLAFRRSGVEWAVVETGLGGLSDATNVTAKELCILTRIGLDHMSVLGNDLRQIAAQKLGIVRPGVPTVLAPQEPGLQNWLQRRLAEIGSPLVPPLRDGQLPQIQRPPGGPRLTRPKRECAATALAAAEVVLGKAGEEETQSRIARVLRTRLEGRLDYRENLAVTGLAGGAFGRAMLDGGHNGAALAALNEELEWRNMTGYSLILALQRDKLVEPLREPLRTLVGGARRVILPAPATPRSVSSAELAAWVGGILPAGRAAPELFSAVGGAREALLAALEHPHRPLVISGSFWMLGAAMGELSLPPLPEYRRGSLYGGGQPGAEKGGSGNDGAL